MLREYNGQDQNWYDGSFHHSRHILAEITVRLIHGIQHHAHLSARLPAKRHRHGSLGQLPQHGRSHIRFGPGSHLQTDSSIAVRQQRTRSHDAQQNNKHDGNRR